MGWLDVSVGKGAFAHMLEGRNTTCKLFFMPWSVHLSLPFTRKSIICGGGDGVHHCAVHVNALTGRSTVDVNVVMEGKLPVVQPMHFPTIMKLLCGP